MDDKIILSIELEETAVRALHSAVVFTLEKWSGQEPVIDQETLLGMKPQLQAAIFEFDFTKTSNRNPLD